MRPAITSASSCVSGPTSSVTVIVSLPAPRSAPRRARRRRAPCPPTAPSARPRRPPPRPRRSAAGPARRARRAPARRRRARGASPLIQTTTRYLLGAAGTKRAGSATRTGPGTGSPRSRAATASAVIGASSIPLRWWPVATSRPSGPERADQRQVVRAARPQPGRRLDQRVLGDPGQHPLGVAQQVAHPADGDRGVEADLGLGGAEHEPVGARHQVDGPAVDQRAHRAARRRERARAAARSRRISPFTGRTSPCSAGCSPAECAPAATSTASARRARRRRSQRTPTTRAPSSSTAAAPAATNATPARSAAARSAASRTRLSTARSSGTDSPPRTSGPSAGSSRRSSRPVSRSTGAPEPGEVRGERVQLGAVAGAGGDDDGALGAQPGGPAGGLGELGGERGPAARPTRRRAPAAPPRRATPR